MIVFDHPVRVLYGHTDQMGVVYYGRYFEYFEAGRNELLRSIGLPYYRMENSGLMLPVVDAHADYKGSFRYDDLITVRSKVESMPTVRIRINYELFAENKEILVTGYTSHVFVDSQTRKPRRVPDEVIAVFNRFFS